MTDLIIFGLAVVALAFAILFVLQLNGTRNYARAAHAWQTAHATACTARDGWQKAAQRWQASAHWWAEFAGVTGPPEPDPRSVAALGDVSRETWTGAPRPYGDPVVVDGGDDDGPVHDEPASFYLTPAAEAALDDEPTHAGRGPEPDSPEWS
jgi:hypothetical protein